MKNKRKDVKKVFFKNTLLYNDFKVIKMKIVLTNFINDLKKNLKREIKLEDITIHSSGMSNSLIFQIRDDYLYKVYHSGDEYKKSEDFFECYKGSSVFQNIVFQNDHDNILCLTYLKGELMHGKDGDYSFIIPQIYEIVKEYKEYELDADNIGFYNFGMQSFKDFLENNINYNYADILDKEMIEENLKIIEKYPIKNYVLHGDFGTHNFVLDKSDLKIIDPCTAIGDKLFDFYCGIFSDPIIFENANIEDILKYFEEYELEYKKALLKICFIFRMLIAVKYNFYKNTAVFYDWYNKIKKL